jgi:hypothetical protein
MQDTFIALERIIDLKAGVELRRDPINDGSKEVFAAPKIPIDTHQSNVEGRC